MNSNGVIKVSDFGLTEDIYSRNYFRQAKDGAKLPLKWMALESIKLGVFSEKSDVVNYFCSQVTQSSCFIGTQIYVQHTIRAKPACRQLV